MKIPIGDYYCVARGYIITCNEDGTVPLNSKVLGMADNDVDIKRLDEMLHRANTQPDLLEALEAIENIAGNLSDSALETATGPNDARHRGIMVTTARQIARAAITRARGE